MKTLFFNVLFMAAAVGVMYLLIRELPDRRSQSSVAIPLSYRTVQLAPVDGTLQLAGSWVATAGDRRFGGLSALMIEDHQFLAVSDLGAVARFDPPTSDRPMLRLADLRDGPGPFGKKSARDAESLAPDPYGRGWWVGYEQRHSLWLYDEGFRRALDHIDLKRWDWPENSGAEGLLRDKNGLLVLAENGREAMAVGAKAIRRLGLNAGAEVADAAMAPDGSAWLLLRSKGAGGISQSIAPLVKSSGGYRMGHAWPLPKGALDNYEGMAIEALPDGRWRFWLVSDDGHRVLARTLLVALDYAPPGYDKSPAMGAGPSKLPSGKMP